MQTHRNFHHLPHQNRRHHRQNQHPPLHIFLLFLPLFPSLSLLYLQLPYHPFFLHPYPLPLHHFLLPFFHPLQLSFFPPPFHQKYLPSFSFSFQLHLISIFLYPFGSNPHFFEAILMLLLFLYYFLVCIFYVIFLKI
ncbi:unnamed protein product [Meloidogyne enterolobii]|uniref:Uncharacterized protein n=1 Tax=Meloidogyne enterolobii TaxID=390850 RepID=A0ACB1A7W9_MELEN